MLNIVSASVVLLLLCIASARATLLIHPPETDSCPVSEYHSSCMTLNAAFQRIASGELGSNTTMELMEGTHTIEDVILVRDLVNLHYIGLGNTSDVIVTCSEGVGLAFINVSGLTFSNMTIQRCGLNDTDDLFSISFSFIDSFYQPSPLFSVGVSLISCTDVVIQDVSFEENIGFGMLAINVLGHSRFTRTHFISNHPSTCALDSLLEPGGAGGGAFVLFTDYRDHSAVTIHSLLVIEHSKFMSNYACVQDLFAILYLDLQRSVQPELQQVFTITRAGGLTITLAQGDYHVDVDVDYCIFENNTSTYNGAAMEAAQFENTDDCHVTVKNTVFENNGGKLVQLYGDSALDPLGALLIAFYLRVPQNRTTPENIAKYIKHRPSTFQAINCTFTDNLSRLAGGIGVFSLGPTIGFVQDKVYVINATFRNNVATYGPAIYITELSYSGFEPGLVVYLENITAESNRVLPSAGSMGSETGIIDISYLSVYFQGYNSFYKNLQTVISTYSALVYFNGTNYFERNFGIMGGALHLDTESYMIMQDGSSVILKDNEAEVAGGGVYVDFNLQNTDSYYDCFLYFGTRFDPFCGDLGGCNKGGNGTTSLQFINNRAPFGSALYGSTFSSCPWGGGPLSGVPQVTPATAIQTMSKILSFSPVVEFTPDISQAENVINTVSLAIVPRNTVTDRVRYSVMPGQEFLLDLGAFDQLLQPVPLTIFSQVDPQERDTTTAERASIGDTDRYLLTGAYLYTSVPITVYGNASQSLNVTISTDEANVQFTFLVHLSECQKGFQFSNEKLACECLVNETLSGVECHPDGSVSYPADSWIGQDNHDNFILHDCIADYCEPMVTDLNLSDPDMQCNNHRSGILCGECQHGYSRVLGSTACRRCHNNAYLALIVAFAILGIVLVVAISSLKITITDGYLNGFIFYGNIISILTYEFFPSGIASTTLALNSFLNLDLGIETCFYDGMTQSAVVALELVFPFYLAGILLVITLFSRFWSRFKVFKNFNAAQVFATLLLLSYSSIIRTCVEIIAVETIDSPSGNLIRWHGDPNVVYFRGLHLFLLLLSVLLLLILIPIPIVLLFPSLIFKVKRLVRLKPLLDAFVAPFKPNRRFWLGFRLIFRQALCFAIYLDQTTPALTATIFLVILLMLQSNLKPFYTRSRNIVDLSLVLNITLLSILALYLKPKGLTVDKDVRDVTLSFSIVASVEFVLLILYYILKAIPPVQDAAQRVKATILGKWRNRDQAVPYFVSKSEHQRPMQTSVRLHSLTIDDFHTTNFIEFRESLLN